MARQGFVSAFAGDDAREAEEENRIASAAQAGTLDRNSAAYRHAKLNGMTTSQPRQETGGGNFTKTDFAPGLGEQTGDAGWSEAIAAQNSERNIQTATGQMTQFNDMTNISNREMEAAEAQKMNAFNTFAGLMKMAKEGRASGNVLQYANRALGMDGVNRGIVACGFLPNGDFSARIATKDRSGQLSFDDQTVGAANVLGIMNSSACFSNDDVQSAKAAFMEQNPNMAESEVDGLLNRYAGKAGMFNRAMANGGGNGINVSSMFASRRPSSISAFGADGNGGFTQYQNVAGTGVLQQQDSGTRKNGAGWKLLSVGPSTTTGDIDENGNADGSQTYRYQSPDGRVFSVRNQSELPKLNADGTVEVDKTKSAAVEAEKLRGRNNRELQEMKGRQSLDEIDARANANLEAENARADANLKLENERAKRQSRMNSVRLYQNAVKAWNDHEKNDLEWQAKKVDMKPEDIAKAREDYIQKYMQDAGAESVGGEGTEEGGKKKTDKTTIKSGDNTKREELPEFDANASYSVGDKFTRNGNTYEVGADGKAHRVK